MVGCHCPTLKMDKSSLSKNPLSTTTVSNSVCFDSLVLKHVVVCNSTPTDKHFKWIVAAFTGLQSQLEFYNSPVLLHSLKIRKLTPPSHLPLCLWMRMSHSNPTNSASFSLTVFQKWLYPKHLQRAPVNSPMIQICSHASLV